MPSPVAAPPVVAVAYSGGRDSTALLHATARVAREQGYRVVALHVHHGLQPAADQWLAHCEATCHRWRRRGWPLAFACTRLALTPAVGASVEAQARQARYAALARMAREHGAGVVLLAHHRTDQAETFVLQALRGSGVAGLAAMPRRAERDGLQWLRPWLHRSRAEIEAYVRRHRLVYIDDDSNADLRFARNRLRVSVWPALTEAFVHAEQALAHAAACCADAAECLQALAAADLQAVTCAAGLSRSALAALGPARARNALRAWYQQVTGAPMPAQALERLWRESEGPARPRSWELPAAVVRLYRDTWSIQPTPWPRAGHVQAPAGQAAPVPAAASAASPALPRPLQLSAPGDVPLPEWQATLRVHAPRTDDERRLSVPAPLLAQARLRARQGGDTFQAGPGRPARRLKKQFQAAGVPAWARGAPLIEAQGMLIFVPGLGVDARAAALPGDERWCLSWEPLPPP